MTEGKYSTVEPFLTGEYDVRIQKIGQNHYRAYRRYTISGNWKTNTGCSVAEEIAVTKEYKRWIDHASKMLGGLDICTVDVIHDNHTGREYILEVNGTSSGLLPERSDEDNGYIHDLVLERMNQALCCS
jgi:glutathione synthase/RimK-type ligase-like ATP-grasp enzyme